ncbi:hypothetical protein [Aliikangiella sp. IMCC44359]|uniref:hypothetical protein n=1 Tax=Aliikangiella sp. IMCC44359 TaxID=3459125 RepID=UPI00403AE749
MKKVKERVCLIFFTIGIILAAMHQLGCSSYFYNNVPRYSQLQMTVVGIKLQIAELEVY